jgi:hypothetical protein
VATEHSYQRELKETNERAPKRENDATRRFSHRIPVSQRHSTSVILPASTSISNGPHGFGNRFSASKTE